MTGLTYDENHNASGASNSSNKNISNSIQNSHYSIGLNNDVITDTKNPDYYKYDNLIKLPDIEIKEFNSINLKSVSKSDLMKMSKNNALKNGAIDANDGKSYFVKNNDETIRVNQKGLFHKKYKKTLSNLRKNVIINAGQLLNDSVKINEVYRDGKTSNVYFTKYYQNGNPYIARFVVVNNELNGIDSFTLYSLSTEKGRFKRLAGANNSYTKWGSSYNSSRFDLLLDVNSISTYKNDLPLDVFYKLNDNYLSSDKDLKGHKYSFGTSLNRLDSSKELKSKVVGYNS